MNYIFNILFWHNSRELCWEKSPSHIFLKLKLHKRSPQLYLVVFNSAHAMEPFHMTSAKSESKTKWFAMQ